MEEFMERSIRSYEARLKAANDNAIAAIGRADYEAACDEILLARGFRACIEELEFQIAHSLDLSAVGTY